MELSHKMPRMLTGTKEKVMQALDVGCTCGGSLARLTRRKVGSAVTVHMQCEGCGRSLCGGLKRSDHLFWQDYPEWDEALSQSYHAAQNRDGHERSALFVDARAEYRTSFLRSPEWRALRNRVMERANYRCEACLTAEASDVHHLRYGIDCLPPAWELRAVCRRCHEALHGASAAWAAQ